jgi:hypothetical protein
MQNDGDFVDVILLYYTIYKSEKGHKLTNRSRETLKN